MEDSPPIKKKIGGPDEQFKNVFDHYGAKLGPDLMRLAIEGGGFYQPLDNEEEDDATHDKG